MSKVARDLSDQAELLLDTDRCGEAEPLFRRSSVGPFLVLVLWHLAATRGWVDARFLPTRMTVLTTFDDWLFGQPGSTTYSGTWLLHTINNSYPVGIGFAIAAVVGVVLGCLIGWFRLVLILSIRSSRSSGRSRSPRGYHSQ
jgi:ABC-type nitrate/sulfonate/bicarbonate transport system permease component